MNSVSTLRCYCVGSEITLNYKILLEKFSEGEEERIQEDRAINSQLRFKIYAIHAFTWL